MKRLFALVFALAILSAATHSLGQTVPAATATCNPKNPSHISATVANRLADEAKDNDSVDCFTYVSAMQGDGTAEAYWAIYLVDHHSNDEAFLWAKKSAGQGNPHGAWNLSKFYRDGVGTSPDPKKAAEWQAIALKDPEFHAHALKSGWITDPPPQAMISSGAIPDATYLCDPYNSRHFTAYQALSQMNRYMDERTNACFAYIAAVQGDALGEANWSYSLMHGAGGPGHKDEAFGWAALSARKGNAFGQNDLAACYENGYGTKVDMEKSKYWKDKAQSDPDFQEELETSKQLARDLAESLKKEEERRERVAACLAGFHNPAYICR